MGLGGRQFKGNVVASVSFMYSGGTANPDTFLALKAGIELSKDASGTTWRSHCWADGRLFYGAFNPVLPPNSPICSYCGDFF